MTFPQSQRVIFNNNPLDEVICQLRFPTILEINAKKPAEFQNKLRNSYPLYEEDQSTFPKEIADIVARLPISPKEENVTYKFLSQDSRRTISLSSDFVAFSETNYRTWDRFFGEIQRAQEALEEVYNPTFYTRIGLRYKDIIDRNTLNIPNEPWENLLKPSILGLLGSNDGVGAHVDNIKTEALIKIDEVPGARAKIQHGLGIKKPENRKVYIVDIDFFTTERSTGQDVAEILRRFNVLGGNFFRWFITERLWDALEARDILPED